MSSTLIIYLAVILFAIVYLLNTRRLNMKFWKENQERVDKISKESLENQVKMIKILEEIRDRIKG